MDAPTLPLPLQQRFEPELRAEIARHAAVRTFEPGAVLMTPGQPVRHVPIVLDGAVKIMRGGDTDGEMLMYYLHPADSCALSLSALDGGQPSPITAVVEEKATVLMVPVAQAEAWMNRFPSWRHFVLQTYQQRFDDLLQTLDSVAFRQMDERLLAYLRRKADLTGGRHLYLTHEDIARDLNTSREVISRLLKQLERLGRVTLARNKISLLAGV